MIEYIMVGAFFLIVFVYYYFFEKPRRTTIKDRKASHFNELEVINKTKPTTFSFYNEKFQNLIIAYIVPTIVGVAVPRFLLPFPINLITTAFVAVIMLFVIVLWSQQLAINERTSAQNNAFAPALNHYPEIGDRNQLFRNAKFESMVYMSIYERLRIVDRIMEDSQKLEYYKRHKEEVHLEGPNKGNKIIDLVIMRKRLTKIILSMIVLRYQIDEDFRILYITDTDPKDLKTANTVKMVHRTVDVKVPLMPFWGFYGGTTSRLYKSMNEKGEIRYVSRRMGIYLDLFNIQKRDKLLLEGGFNNPDKMTLLLGEFLHLFEQQVPTVEEHNKTMRRIELRDLEAMKTTFENQAEANSIVQSTKHLLEVLASILKAKTRDKVDYGLAVILFLIGIVFGYVIYG